METSEQPLQDVVVEKVEKKTQPFVSQQPEFFCTNCGAETSEAENAEHAYLCYECAR